MNFDDIIDNDQHFIINRIPKIQYEEFENYSKDPNTLLLIPNSSYEIISPFIRDMKFINENYHLFYISIHNLTVLINEIIKTDGKYAYPLIFVNFIKHSLNVKTKINFNQEMLLYLRIWSNQIREIGVKSSLSHYSINNNSTKIITYIGYKICCELIYYYKNHQKR